MLETVYQIRPSRTACMIAVVFFIASILIILYCQLSFSVSVLCLLFLFWSMQGVYHQLVNDAKLTLYALPHPDWLIMQEGQSPIVGVLAGDTMVTPYFILLRFLCRDKTRSYVVLRDSLEPRVFKHFLLHLMTK